MTSVSALPSRRLFLRNTAVLAAAGVAAPLAARATVLTRPVGRSLVMDHTHTGEHLDLVYANSDQYVPAALQKLDRFLRDHYSGQVGSMDPKLFDLLHRLRLELRARRPLQVISGYRSPHTNQMLKTTRGGGVAKRSLHMDGKAIDIRLPGVPLADLRDAALSLRAGGVGYYPKDQFVHVDTGRVRHW